MTKTSGGERVVVVHLQKDLNDSQEFEALAQSAGGVIVATLMFRIVTFTARFALSTGKVSELKQQVLDSSADLVLINGFLTPTQERNIEREICCRVLDRTGLILDIFASRARSYEGKLQVELAQLRYHATRLVRGWTHLERQKGGIGLRGPGETQLEVDRRLIRGRIQYIQARLKKVAQQREQNRQARKKASVPMVALVGYTNAGKSTLFNALTRASVYAADQVFATLDPTWRAVKLPTLDTVMFADTVGFIRDLPHTLIQAFRATLEETREADLLLHVIDSQEACREQRIEQVNSVLSEIGALEVPSIEVYNKIDCNAIPPKVERDDEGRPKAVWVSASKMLGLELLKETIVECLATEVVVGRLCLSVDQHKERALLFNMNSVVNEKISENGNSIIEVRIPKHKWQQLCFQYPTLEGLLESVEE